MSDAERSAWTQAPLTLALCFLGAICEGLDLQSAGVAAAGIRAQFHPDPAQLGHFFSASTVGLFVGAILGGRLSDRIGRKPVLVVAVGLFGLFSLLTPMAWDFGSLQLARVLTGLGLGGALPNLIAMASESVSASRRSASVTLMYAGVPTGGAVASLIALLVPIAQWRWIFIVGGILPILLSPAIGRWLAESQAYQRARAAAAHESRPARGNFLHVFAEQRAVRTVLLWVSFFLALLTLYLLLNWLPTLLIGSGLSKSQAAWAQILFNVGGAFGSLWVGRFLEGEARRAVLLLTFVGLPVLLAALGAVAGAAAQTVCVVGLLGVSIMAAQSILYALAPSFYPTRIRGIGVGSAVAIGRIGSIVGPILGSILVGQGRSSGQVLAGILPVVIAGSGCAIVLSWRRVRPPE